MKTRRFFLAMIAVIGVAMIADAQFSGTGTTGPTSGPNQSNGSGGVQMGSGPDTRPNNTAATQTSEQTVTSAQAQGTETATRSTSSKSEKRAKKTRKHSTRTSPSPSATASPSR